MPTALALDGEEEEEEAVASAAATTEAVIDAVYTS
jgi:hypothetical protein